MEPLCGESPNLLPDAVVLLCEFLEVGLARLAFLAMGLVYVSSLVGDRPILVGL